MFFSRGAFFEKTAPLDPLKKLLIESLGTPNKNFCGVQGRFLQKEPLLKFYFFDVQLF